MAKSGGKRTIAEEYIVSIIPELDKDKFNKERAKIGEIVGTKKSGRKPLDNEEKKRRKEEKEKLKLQKELNKDLKITAGIINSTTKGYDKVIGSFGKFSTTAMVIVSVLGTALETFKEITKSAKEFSNSMITAGSAFVNRDTRNLMARFGVSGQTATGMQSVMGLMGITPEDFRMMTPGQMQLYTRLMAQWQAGMDSISKTDMSKFQQTMQSIQAEMASAKLELQIELYKMLVDMAPAIEEFYKSIISLIKSLAELLNSPLVKGILSTLSGLISGVVRIVSALAKVLSFDFAGAWDALSGNDTNTGNTTNYYSISSTSTNTFAGDTSSMYAIATQTQQDEINSIAATIHSTGGT